MNLSIIIPAYNEGRHLDAVIRRLHGAIKAQEPSFEIVIVNNGSTDTTGEVAAALASEHPEIRVATVTQNQGYGNGILTGLTAAQGDVLGYMHADEQALPEYLLSIYSKLQTEGHDICKAVRVERHEHRWRIVQSFFYNNIFRTMFGMHHRDINGTPKLMTREFYAGASLDSKKWFLDPEIMIKAHGRGAKIGEVDIIWRTRAGGKSKVHLATMWHFITNMIRYRYRNTM